MTRSGREHPTETPDVSHVKNIDVTHELSDVNVGAILTFGGVLTAMSLAICVGLYFLFGYYNTKEQAKEPKAGPMAMTKEERLPPEPRLQNAPGFGLKLENGQWINLEQREPAAEYLELRKQWEQTLNVGLKDQSNKVVGLPIGEAMRILVQRNLVPTRTLPGETAKVEDYGISIPTQASSGRVSEKLR